MLTDQIYNARFGAARGFGQPPPPAPTPVVPTPPPPPIPQGGQSVGPKKGGVSKWAGIGGGALIVAILAYYMLSPDKTLAETDKEKYDEARKRAMTGTMIGAVAGAVVGYYIHAKFLCK